MFGQDFLKFFSLAFITELVLAVCVVFFQRGELFRIMEQAVEGPAELLRVGQVLPYAYAVFARHHGDLSHGDII